MEQIAFFLSGVFVKYFRTYKIFQDTSVCETIEELLIPMFDAIFNKILKRAKICMRIIKRANL